MKLRKTLLKPYGVILKDYSGTNGVLIINNQEYFGDFYVAQYCDGNIVLLFQVHLLENQSISYGGIDVYRSFEGTTNDGLKIRCENFLTEVNNLNSDSPLFFERVFFLNELIVTKDDTQKAIKVRGLISNFVFKGFSWDTSNLFIKNDSFENCYINKIKEYQKNVSTIQALHSILPTTEISFSLKPDSEKEEYINFLDYLCLILSVSRGTRIQWLNYQLIGKNNKILKNIHIRNINRSYNSGLHIPINRSLTNNSEDELFIEKTVVNFPKYCRDPSTLLFLVNGYLKTRSNDFLQVKGHAIAIVFEMIKEYALYTSDFKISDIIIEDSDQLNEITESLKEKIREYFPGKKNSQMRILFYENISGINRFSFKHLLKEFFAKIDLEMPDGELNQVIKSRNSLVHTGNYLCAKLAKEEGRTSTIDEYEKEYLMLLKTLDKIFIQLLIKYQ